MKTRLALFTITYIAVFACFGQLLPEKGVPLLRNYTPDQYQNMGKIWSIRSAPNGIVYMAADKGLLEYDGESWNSFRGSNGFTRSVVVVNDSLIYTGSDLDFGVWQRNPYRAFEYTSLYPFREEAHELNEEFWHVYPVGEDIVFVSSHNLYIYKNEQIIRLAAPSRFWGAFDVDGLLYLADERDGILTLKDFSLQHIVSFPDMATPEISGMYSIDEALVIATRDLGLFLYTEDQLTRIDNALSRQLSAAKIFSFEKTVENHVAFGTVLRGLFVADKEGNIVHHINRHKGLSGNTVLSMHYGKTGKLWLGLDHGIASVYLNSRFTYFFDFRGDFGTGNTAVLKNRIFYLGTNQGLYRSGWDDLNNDVDFFQFRLVPETEGQVWTLKKVDDALLMGHDKGLFVVRDNAIEPLFLQDGVWTILPFGDYLFTGNYNGISIFKKSANNWVFERKMDLILGSCNQLIMQNENILWVNIPNYGIIRAVLNEELQPEERQFFTLDHFDGDEIWLKKDQHEVYAYTSTSQYVFDDDLENFVRISDFSPPAEVQGLVAGFYQPLPLHPQYDFFPVYNGFALGFLSDEIIISHHQPSLTLRRMEAFSNQERMHISPGAKVPYHLNNLRIKMLVPNQQNVLYQYRLGESDEWSEWSLESTVELLNLEHGRYRLFVRAFVDEKVIEKQSIEFSVAAPWYRTWYANISYVLLLSLFFYLLLLWQKVSLKKQKEEFLKKEQMALHEQSEKHKQEILRLEQERLQMEYDQLKQQMKTKTVELANKARDNEEKNKLLLTLKEKCEKAQRNPEISKIKWAEMQRLLDSYLKVEDKTFEIQMDELHQEFFKKLKDKFPGLSNNDLRLCAYLKIGLNSKEIAELLNIQPSSSYISRSRLRKKLNLKADQDLYSFLNSV